MTTTTINQVFQWVFALLGYCFHEQEEYPIPPQISLKYFRIAVTFYHPQKDMVTAVSSKEELKEAIPSIIKEVLDQKVLSRQDLAQLTCLLTLVVDEGQPFNTFKSFTKGLFAFSITKGEQMVFILPHYQAAWNLQPEAMSDEPMHFHECLQYYGIENGQNLPVFRNRVVTSDFDKKDLEDCLRYASGWLLSMLEGNHGEYLPHENSFQKCSELQLTIALWSLAKESNYKNDVALKNRVRRLVFESGLLVSISEDVSFLSYLGLLCTQFSNEGFFRETGHELFFSLKEKITHDRGSIKDISEVGFLFLTEWLIQFPDPKFALDLNFPKDEWKRYPDKIPFLSTVCAGWFFVFGEKTWAEFVIEMNYWLITEKQIRYQRHNNEVFPFDFLGGFSEQGNANAVHYIQGLTFAVVLAKRLGKPEHHELYIQLKCALLFCFRLVMTNAQTLVCNFKGQSIGGVCESLTDYTQKVERTAHWLNALLTIWKFELL